VLHVTANTVNPEFEKVYDKYSPKIYGFISQYTSSKKQAEEYLINVFIKLHTELEHLDINDERTIQRIVFLICKPLLKLHQTNLIQTVEAHE
jgi:DNA-directed RNA polymerase specialized sigma24 family protein